MTRDMTCTSLAVPLGLLLLSQTAVAQLAPDAGSTLRQQQQQQLPDAPKAAPGLNLIKPTLTPPAPGGSTVNLKAVQFSGNTRVGADVLSVEVQDAIGRDLDLAQLWTLAARVTARYQRAGFPFARAYLPQQQVLDGVLRIEVVEGRYGRVTTSGDPALAAAAQAFLAGLKPGTVVESGPLERAVLIVGDLPGVEVLPVMRPGQQNGTGDLDLQMKRLPAWQTRVALDNHGNRYTGEYQARVDTQLAGALAFGDQLKLQFVASDLGLWTGGLGYSLPLGTDGVRGQVEASHTRYQLGREFSSLDATGTADTGSLGVSYPWLRSQNANVRFSAGLTGKRLRDAEGAAGTSRRKHSTSVPLTVSADQRDDGGDGVSYGALGLTAGRLALDAAQQANDATTARTAGSFQKLTLDVARIQRAGASSQLYGRVAAQWANKNLDSSEGFVAGGLNGVRAYPSGEGFGNEGVLAQLEWRWRSGDLAPYAFFDASQTRINARPWAATRNSRSLSGTGLGIRGQREQLSFDASLATRLQGGAPVSTSAHGKVRLWASVSMAL